MASEHDISVPLALCRDCSQKLRDYFVLLATSAPVNQMGQCAECGKKRLCGSYVRVARQRQTK